MVGDLPPTKTLGFRWSAIDNPFATTADLGAEEWQAQRVVDPENAEKKQRQFVWCLPYDPPEVDLTPLSAEQVQGRAAAFKKGVVPDDCVGVAIGIDTGKRMLHWEAKALRANGGAAVIEYGDHPVDSDRMGTTQGLVQALTELRAYFSAGWRSESGQVWEPSQVWIDSGYHEHTDAIYEFCRQANQGLKVGSEVYRPSKGYGEGQLRMSRYVAPKSKTSEIRYIGKEYHISWIRWRQDAARTCQRGPLEERVSSTPGYAARRTDRDHALSGGELGRALGIQPPNHRRKADRKVDSRSRDSPCVAADRAGQPLSGRRVLGHSGGAFCASQEKGAAKA